MKTNVETAKLFEAAEHEAAGSILIAEAGPRELVESDVPIRPDLRDDGSLHGKSLLNIGAGDDEDINAVPDRRRTLHNPSVDELTGRVLLNDGVKLLVRPPSPIDRKRDSEQCNHHTTNAEVVTPK